MVIFECGNLVKKEKTVYIRSNNSMKEGVSNANDGTTRYKTYPMENTRNDNTEYDRLPSRNSNSSKGNGIFENSKQGTSQNERRTSNNIESNNIENSSKSSFFMW